MEPPKLSKKNASGNSFLNKESNFKVLGDFFDKESNFEALGDLTCALDTKNVISSTMNIRIFLSVLCAALAMSEAHARVGVYALPAKYGVKGNQNSWNQINTRTWDVFTSFDGNEILGLDSERYTLLQTEFYTSGVVDGRKVGDSTIVASFSDRGAFFGGEGYTDLNCFAPLGKKYAMQVDFLGGWKYDITTFADIDIGGHIIYSDKKIAGPGFTGLGGTQWKGDIYAGFIFPHFDVNPFVYFSYDPALETIKFIGGLRPVFDLEPFTAIEGLLFEMKLECAYVDAKNWAADDTFYGRKWKNSYFYAQTEANLVYLWNKKVRTFIGVGYAYNNDEKYAPNGAYLSPKNVAWFSCGIGYLF